MVKERGEAYAIFDCNSSKREILDEIPHLRRAVGTPQELELRVADGITEPITDKRNLELKPIPEIRDYLIVATYMGKSNQETAEELGSILNQAYQSQLYQAGEIFQGRIIYNENNNYVSL